MLFRSMLDATLFLVGLESDGSLVTGANPCSMCKRMIINAGISTVIVRDTLDRFRSIKAYDEWVMNDDSLEGLRGY